ncbi:hypothetical protein CKO42_24290 [Lamprobacter modestohalophilus]|uniref:Uncharacterized protein n=1 Tax=Lamprobacter modestohalophilus TaxID=1064514 RepID=A0A9X0WDG5_9GAMM|nr:UPF0175 family protein [Lamprobacter modestohalophilus]MBK1621473.1 hypothetical protein [Lamprobacter modestohalophilus]
MTTRITFDFDASALGALRLALQEFARELRIAAAVQCYAHGIVSQGKALDLTELPPHCCGTHTHPDSEDGQP